MILITGGKSLLGKAVAKKLASMGENVRCHDFMKPETVPEGVEFVSGDILKPLDLTGIFKDVKTLIHLKEKLRPGSHGRKLMRDINVKGTKNIINMAVEAGVDNIMLLSSYSVYGKLKKIPAAENIRMKPATGYGKDKLLGEQLLKKYTAGSQIKTTVIRPAVVTGPGTGDPIILQTMYMAMGIGEENIVYISGEGDTRFQLLDIEDSADAFVLALSSDKSAGKVYNAGSDNVPTNLEQAEKIKKAMNLNYTIQHCNPLRMRLLSIILSPAGSNYFTREHLIYMQQNMVLDCCKIKDELGWSPKKDNLDIIGETAAWYVKEKKLAGLIR